MPISRKKYPLLYALNVERHRFIRGLFWLSGRNHFARKCDRQSESVSVRVFRHKSVLMRHLGQVDMRLQHNKVTNLRLAADRIDGVIIRPGESFSFWRLVGRPSSRRGFLPGMLLSQGEVIEGIGGGLCQMGNLLYWMFLHLPLTVTERHRHSFDVFPDSGRVLPFGSGATLFYNYVDLQAHNPTDCTFRIRLRVGGRFLRGEILANRELEHSYRVIERNHRFVRPGDSSPWFRENDIYRRIIDRRTGNTVAEELVTSNHSEVKYDYQPEPGFLGSLNRPVTQGW